MLKHREECLPHESTSYDNEWEQTFEKNENRSVSNKTQEHNEYNKYMCDDGSNDNANRKGKFVNAINNNITINNQNLTRNSQLFEENVSLPLTLKEQEIIEHLDFFKQWYLLCHGCYILLLVFIGSVIFYWSEPNLIYIDALFIAMSTVCNCGLTTIDMSNWNTMTVCWRYFLMLTGGVVLTSCLPSLLRLVMLYKVWPVFQLHTLDSFSVSKLRHAKYLHACRLWRTSLVCAFSTITYLVVVNVIIILCMKLGNKSNMPVIEIISISISSFHGCVFTSMSKYAADPVIIGCTLIACALGFTAFPIILQHFLRCEWLLLRLLTRINNYYHQPTNNSCERAEIVNNEVVDRYAVYPSNRSIDKEEHEEYEEEKLEEEYEEKNEHKKLLPHWKSRENIDDSVRKANCASNITNLTCSNMWTSEHNAANTSKTYIFSDSSEVDGNIQHNNRNKENSWRDSSINNNVSTIDTTNNKFTGNNSKLLSCKQGNTLLTNSNNLSIVSTLTEHESCRRQEYLLRNNNDSQNKNINTNNILECEDHNTKADDDNADDEGEEELAVCQPGKWNAAFNDILTSKNPGAFHSFLFNSSEIYYLTLAWITLTLVQALPIWIHHWHSPFMNDYSSIYKIYLSVCQAGMVRFAGITLLPLEECSHGHIALTMFAMFIPALPIPTDRTYRKWKEVFRTSVVRLLTSRLFWLFVAILTITFTEEVVIASHEKGNEFDILTRVFFEVISAYANCGLSLSFKEEKQISFSGFCRPLSRFVIILVLFGGRHRFVDLGIDLGFANLQSQLNVIETEEPSEISQAYANIYSR